MTPDEWKRAEVAFLRALRGAADQREQIVGEALSGEPRLAGEVLRWLESDAAPYGDDELQDPLGGFEPRVWAQRRSPLLGARLGGYRIVEFLGEGGMGVVYRAERTDGAFEQTVAIKCLKPEKASRVNIGRFLAERRTLASLDHPNIGRLFDGGDTQDGTPFLVMEYVEGQPIDRYCDDRQLGLEARLTLMATVCKAVHFAHRNLIVHRDIKPGNILIDVEGRPKLVDFGIARWLGDPAATSPTETHDRAWTPDYASPEQRMGAGATTAMDVYSLGVVLYQLLTGRLPRGHRAELGRPGPAHTLRATPDRPSTALRRAGAARSNQVDPGGGDPVGPGGAQPAVSVRRLRGDLDRIVMMALHEDPNRRYPSAEALGADLERFLAGRAIAARGDSWTYRAFTFARRNRALVAASLLGLISVAITLSGTLRAERMARRSAMDAKDRALVASDTAEFVLDAFMTSPASEDEGLIRGAADRLRKHAQRVRFEYRDRPGPRADLLAELAEVYARMGMYAEANELHREALAIREETFGSRAFQVGTSLAALGGLHFKECRFEEALGVLQEALALQREHPNRPGIDEARVLNDLGACLRALDRHDEAEVSQRKALALRRAVAPGSLDVATSANNLGVTLIGSGQYEEARELLEEALAIRSRVLTERHRLTAQTRINLVVLGWYTGPFHDDPGDLIEAEALLRSLGRDGRTSLTTLLFNRSGMHIRRREWEQANEAIDEALALHAQRFAPNEPLHTRMLARKTAAMERTYDGPVRRVPPAR